MKFVAASLIVLALCMAFSGCIWFHKRGVDVDVSNDLGREVGVLLTLDRVAVGGSVLYNHYNGTSMFGAGAARTVVIGDVGNGDYVFRASFVNQTGTRHSRPLGLFYGEGRDSSSTHVLVRVEAEDLILVRFA